MQQKLMYKKVFNTYLTPNSMGYLKYKGGINKQSVSNLF